MLIDTTTRTSGITPFGPSFETKSSTQAGNASFEAQLSSALAESLEKLGLANSGEVNITIRNPTATTRQILVTYSVTPEAGAAATPAASLPSSEPIPEAPAQQSMSWAPYNGPRDSRDQLPAGGGSVTSSGAPQISLSDTPAANQYGYTGPAARNPYFTTPSNPLREGYVAGFHNWFQDAMMLGGMNGPMPANKLFYATEEGAQEALRIVEQFSPGAKVVKDDWTSGPFSISKPSYLIDLGDGRTLNAGGVLNSYYNQGLGVTASSDETIRRSIQLA